MLIFINGTINIPNTTSACITALLGKLSALITQVPQTPPENVNAEEARQVLIHSFTSLNIPIHIMNKKVHQDFENVTFSYPAPQIWPYLGGVLNLMDDVHHISSPHHLQHVPFVFTSRTGGCHQPTKPQVNWDYMITHYHWITRDCMLRTFWSPKTRNTRW